MQILRNLKGIKITKKNVEVGQIWYNYSLPFDKVFKENNEMTKDSVTPTRLKKYNTQKKWLKNLV